MIYDAFMFFNELDLLEIRLNELAGVVDTFVLTEGTLTHQGNEKPLYFDDNKERFSEFNIEHVIVDDYTGVDLSDSWQIEYYQRGCGAGRIEQMKPTANDVILSSDLDEIWRADRVERYANTTGWTNAGAYMPMFYYWMNCFQTATAWFQPRWIKGDYLTARPLRGGGVDTEFVNVGWHFSYLGNSAAIQEKLKAFSHTEYNQAPFTQLEYIELKMSRLESLFDSENEFRRVSNLEYLPRYVLDNLDRFGKYILTNGANNG